MYAFAPEKARCLVYGDCRDAGRLSFCESIMNKEAPILIVDDEEDMRTLLQRSLAPELNRVIETAASGKEALDRMEAAEFDLLLADIRMPGMDGLELLQHVRDRRPDITVVMMTAYGSIETAVTAMRMGAHDFVTKPFDHDALVIRLEKALERSTLLRENSRLKQDCLSDPPPVFQDIAGNSAVMRRVFETIRQVARTDPTVLITGESGTGKELTARAIHALSPRSRGPFISVNCPAVPEQILESELFGYKKGAFTHAITDKPGLFQASHTGTIFLDEIGDVPPLIQTKLLRVLQEKEIKPLGSSRNVYVDVRIIASTNRDLKEQIRHRAFREELYSRLNVLAVRLHRYDGHFTFDPEHPEKSDFPRCDETIVRTSVARKRSRTGKRSSPRYSVRPYR